MASPNFISYDRTLRRMYMLNLVEALSPQPEFRASLVVNPRTGRPLSRAFDGSLGSVQATGCSAPARSESRVSARA